MIAWRVAPDSTERDWSYWTLLALDVALLLALGGGLLSARMAPAAFTGFSGECAFKAATGWDCPGCGATRSIVALSMGRPVESVLLNPLPLALLAFAVWRLAARACELCFGRTPQFKHSDLILVSAILILAVWLWGRLLLEMTGFLSPV